MPKTQETDEDRLRRYFKKMKGLEKRLEKSTRRGSREEELPECIEIAGIFYSLELNHAIHSIARSKCKYLRTFWQNNLKL